MCLSLHQLFDLSVVARDLAPDHRLPAVDEQTTLSQGRELISELVALLRESSDLGLHVS